MDLNFEDRFIENFNNSNPNFRFFKKDDRLFLQSVKHREWLPFTIDFSSNEFLRRKKSMGLGSEISKAVGIKGSFKPRILDLTAGMGRDSFIFASLGSKVTMVERNPIIYTLLNNALNIARDDSNIKETIARMELINMDSVEFLKKLSHSFDAIYIDPMFPETNKSRLVKKEMQLFREVVGDDLDSTELFNLAMEQPVKRVVVKRMVNSEYIGGLKPNFEIKGVKTRFDVYTPSI